MPHILGDRERDRFIDGFGDVLDSGGLYCMLETLVARSVHNDGGTTRYQGNQDCQPARGCRACRPRRRRQEQGSRPETASTELADAGDVVKFDFLEA